MPKRAWRNGRPCSWGSDAFLPVAQRFGDHYPMDEARPQGQPVGSRNGVYCS